MGREAELAQLHHWLDKASNGERQIIFVTGEPGIGKTSLVEAFLTQVVSAGKAWVGRGQCIEHYGAGEAYLPMLEALGRLCRGPGGTRLIKLLGRYAPSWLVQMPSLLSAAEFEALQRKVAGVTRERMLREMAEALEAMTGVGVVREPPLLVLWLEDLHWSDYSTLELLASLARRQERARLLLIGTYRPVETLRAGHPLRMIKQELHLHRQCEELRLGFLTENDVDEYLTMRFDVGAHGRAPLQGLARAIRQRTEGNPLFMVNLVDYLIAHGVLVEQEGQWEVLQEKIQVGVPEGLQQHHSLAFLYGNDPGVHCLSMAARVLWLLGYPEQALKKSHEALTLAQKLSHPFSLAWALHFAAVLHQHRRERQAVQERAEAVMALSREQGFALQLAVGVLLRGWALAEQGQNEEGLTQMRQGLAAYQTTGAKLGWPYQRALLAEAYGKVGQAEEGVTTLNEALAAVDKTGERFYEAELYRLKGTLMLQSKTGLGHVSGKSQASQNKSEDTNPQHPRSRSVFSQGH